MQVEVVCRSLAWAGDPVPIALPSGGSPDQLDIQRVDGTLFGVAARLEEGALDVIASQAVVDPFGSWPPELAASDVHFPTAERVAFTPFEPGQLGFVAEDTSSPMSELVLGGTLPGENGSTFVPLGVQAGGALHDAARSALGAYLVVTGFPSFVSAHLIERYAAPPEVIDLGSLGCAEVAPPASVSPLVGADGFWVLHASDEPFDDCLDPDLPGPALYANLRRVEEGTVGDHAFKQATDPFTELDVAGASDGAWVGVRVGDRREYSIYRDDFDAPLAVLVPDLTPARHALAAMGSGLAVSELVSATAQPGGELRVRFVRPDGSSTFLESEQLPPFAVGEPALFASVDPPAMLVAYAIDDGTVLLARADCLE